MTNASNDDGQAQAVVDPNGLPRDADRVTGFLRQIDAMPIELLRATQAEIEAEVRRRLRNASPKRLHKIREQYPSLCELVDEEVASRIVCPPWCTHDDDAGDGVIVHLGGGGHHTIDDGSYTKLEPMPFGVGLSQISRDRNLDERVLIHLSGFAEHNVDLAFTGEGARALAGALLDAISEAGT